MSQALDQQQQQQAAATSGTAAAGVSLAGIRDAAERISSHVHVTPVLTCKAMDEMSGGKRVFFKCELFQKTGSFKVRGACNAVLLAPPDCQNVVTHSSGNHAQAVAWTAKTRGINAHIIMNTNASEIKVDSVRGYGATITFCEPTTFGREETAAEVLAGLPNAVLIHPSEDPHIICGAGTLGLELVDQVRALCAGGDLDAVIVPIGGGGMISGVATVVKELCPGIRVIGAEPEGSDAAARSKASGELLGNEGALMPDTIADGLRVSIGDVTWPIVRDSVDEVVRVSDEDILRWMRVVYERMKLVIEPSAAVGVAALMSPRVRSLPLERVGVILCGGNVDVSKLQSLLVGHENAPSLS